MKLEAREAHGFGLEENIAFNFFSYHPSYTDVRHPLPSEPMQHHDTPPLRKSCSRTVKEVELTPDGPCGTATSMNVAISRNSFKWGTIGRSAAGSPPQSSTIYNQMELSSLRSVVNSTVMRKIITFTFSVKHHFKYIVYRICICSKTAVFHYIRITTERSTTVVLRYNLLQC